ncbi:MAG: hypothetical protein Q9224_005197 [Gallowayella concinna]
MADSTAIANTALVISIVALFVTTAQLLSQIFSTAEGYRRCQPSVIGPWANLTKRKWRWSSFRFETLVVTPEIVLGSPSEFRRTMAMPEILELLSIIPKRSDDRLNYTNDVDQVDISTDPSIALEAPAISQTLPVLFNRTRSWDFMPPDVVRPFASTRVTYLAIIALRMGMTWKRFEPEQGALEAEGNGHSLNSVLIRALGTVVRYTPSIIHKTGPFMVISYLHYPESMLVPDSSAHVETPQADRMWFGILPANKSLVHIITDFPIGDYDSIYAMLDKMDPSRKSSEALAKVAPSLLGFNDIIPMLAPWMRQRGTTVNKIPAVTYDPRGITCFSGPRDVFLSKLHERIASAGSSVPQDEVGCKPETLPKVFSEQPLISIHQRLNKIMTLHQQIATMGFHDPTLQERRIAYYDLLQTNYDLTTEYFLIWTNGIDYSSPLSYFELVKTHVVRAVTVRERALKYFEQDPGTSEMSAAMMVYWDDIPYYQKVMQEKGFTDRDQVEEAWIVLMFRAILWSHAHVFDHRQTPLPTRYYGSSIPVYIG